MAQPVWVLSVDLQTKTATFQSGLADAARAARGSFGEIKTGAGEMGGHVSGHMGHARHSVMLLAEEFGGHVPRAIASFIASLGPVGSVLAAAFPFMAIAMGATLLLEHLHTIHEKHEELARDQVNLQTAVNNAFNALDQKLLQAQIRSDDLHHNHLAGLHHQLELIDAQSLGELVRSFEEVAKAADKIFDGLKVGWYQFGSGSTGAKHALLEFRTEYEHLLSEGKDKEAAGLLAGTQAQAQKVYDLMKAARGVSGGSTADTQGDTARYNKAAEAISELKKLGIGYTKEELQSQQAVLSILNSQAGAQERISALKKLESENAERSTANTLSGMASQGARQSAEHTLRMGELTVQADKQTAQLRQLVQNASIAERLQDSLTFEQREFEIQQQANRARIAALDKNGKDYNNQLRALQDAGEELVRSHEVKVSGLRVQAEEQQFRESLTNLEQGNREAIEATRRGSEERIAAIDVALREEETLHRQNTAGYRALQTLRVETTRQMTEEQNKLTAEAGKEQAEHDLKMGEIELAAHKEQLILLNSGRRVLIQERIVQEVELSNQEFALKQQALQNEMAALDKNGKDYENRLKALQDKEKQLIRQHENEVSVIKDRAQIERNQRTLAAYQRATGIVAQELTSVIMRHQSMATMLSSIGEQMLAGMLQNAIKSAILRDLGKEKEAAQAAREGYLWGWKHGGPAAPIIAPITGALAFASVMAFNAGTDAVPGVGRGDVVPSMLTPGEGIVPGGVMDGLRNMARNGGFEQQRPSYVVHVRPTYHVNTIDGDGMRDALEKHTDTLQRHFENAVRKMNQG